MIKNKIVVAFFFHGLFDGWQGGKNYYRSLFNALDLNKDSKISVVAVVGKNIDISLFEFPKSVKFIKTQSLDYKSKVWYIDKIFNKIFGVKPFLRFALLRENVSLVSHSDPSETSRLPTISWIPDFQHVYLPHFFDEKEIKYRDENFNHLLKKSDCVIVSSFAAKNDLISFAPEYAGKARVLQFTSIMPNVNNFGDLYDLKEEFFYFPGQCWAHKNHLLAIEALLNVCQEFPNAKIICSGLGSDYRNNKHYDYLTNKVKKLKLEKNFIFLGLIPYEHISYLMSQSCAVINPSLFEGWSTTVEEAKAIEAPLLLSDIPVHREQCQNDEAIFFDPSNPAALAELMVVVLSRKWPKKLKNSLGDLKLYHLNRTLKFAKDYEKIVEEVLR